MAEPSRSQDSTRRGRQAQPLRARSTIGRQARSFGRVADRTDAPGEFARVMGPGLLRLQVDIADITKYVLNVFWGLKPEEEPLRPEAAAILKERQTSGRDFQAASCLPASVPAAMSILTFKMIQAPNQIVVVLENGDPVRQIHTGGRSLPFEDPKYYTRPFGYKTTLTLLPDTDVLEYVCTENWKNRGR